MNCAKKPQTKKPQVRGLNPGPNKHHDAGTSITVTGSILFGEFREDVVSHTRSVQDKTLDNLPALPLHSLLVCNNGIFMTYESLCEATRQCSMLNVALGL